MADKKYKFNTIKDRTVITLSSVAGVTLFGASLSLFFNPIAIGVAGAVGAVCAGAMSTPAFYKRFVKKSIKRGTMKAVPADAPISGIAAQISRQLGRSDAPQIYVWDDASKKPQTSQGERSKKEQEAEGRFAAITGANALLTTTEALNNERLTEPKFRFIAAHEISHLMAKDHLSLSSMARAFFRGTSFALVAAALVAAGASVAGVTLPVFAAASIWMAAAPAVSGGVAVLGAVINQVFSAAGGLLLSVGWSDVINNIGHRKLEQRADRNAVAITRDLDGAKEALFAIQNDKTRHNILLRGKYRTNYFNEIFRTHPTYKRRIKILTRAFKKISKLPPIEAPAKAATPVQPQQQAAPSV